jgi:hypothetical protein
MAADRAAAPAHQVDLSRDDTILAEGLDDLFLQLLLGDGSVTVVVFSPEPRTFRSDIVNRNARGFQSFIFGFRQFQRKRSIAYTFKAAN